MESESDVYVELDVGNLLVNNIVLIKKPFGRELNEEALKHVASQGAQRLLNEIFKLPSEYHEHVPVAKLPAPTTVIPREKHVPKEKAMTKWQKFAKAKGIQKKKKDKLVWDDASKDWKPRFGYRSIKNKDDWMVEVPQNAPDPNADFFAKAKEARKEKIAKNEYQRLRNIATATKVKVTNLESVDRADKHQLSRSLAAAKTATASIGKFADRLPNERPPKNKMKKREFKANIPSSMSIERDNNLRIFEGLDKKAPKLNVDEAVQKYIAKPAKQGIPDERREMRNKKLKAKKNKHKKNVFRSGKKGGRPGFKNPT
ncbi:ribosome biogenesis regulatory protein homolog [Parasteatoda tepidariorum]|uniref:ribosome biogenesis regulatory protein homolog n=1 Tax=Parasteatoda tepidariorum TaxID=114398 RepID=UPI00077FC968|nr:ribosome biogenesis regulatory protein homolog [Parasteatoda tepidariorum]